MFINGSPLQSVVAALGTVIEDYGHNKNYFTKSGEQFRLLFEDSTVGMAFINEGTTIILVNKEFEKLTGYPGS